MDATPLDARSAPHALCVRVLGGRLLLRFLSDGDAPDGGEVAAADGDAYDEDCPLEEWVLQSLSTECGEPFLQLSFRYDWFGKAPLRIVDAPWKQTNQLIMGAIIAALLCICVIIVIVIVMVAR